MQNLIKKIYYDNYTVYGARRIFEILRNKGYRVSYKIIYDFCHSLNLVSVDERVKVYHKIKLDIKGFKIKKTSNKFGDGVYYWRFRDTLWADGIRPYEA